MFYIFSSYKIANLVLTELNHMNWIVSKSIIIPNINKAWINETHTLL